jgi:phage-related protein
LASTRWTVETIGDVVDSEMEALPASVRARLVRLLEMLENLGLERVREPHVKHLEGKLWEVRAMGSDGMARAIHVTMETRRIVILHVFLKKSRRTPTTALALARSRLRSLMH